MIDFISLYLTKNEFEFNIQAHFFFLIYFVNFKKSIYKCTYMCYHIYVGDNVNVYRR